MALTEQRIIKSVTISPGLSVSVQWADQILKDDVVISETYHRCAYTEEQKSLFLAEVDGADAYLAVLGWV